MICLGDRCRYRFCGYEDSELPPVGTVCFFERWYSRKLSKQFLETFPRDGLGRYLDHYDELHEDWVIGHLLTNRTAVRLARAMEAIERSVANREGGVIDRAPFNELALATRYSAAARTKIRAVYDQMPRVRRRIREAKISQYMAAHGFFKAGQPPHSVDDAPEWIIRLVDGEQ